MVARNTKATNKLPIFDGHAVETQRLKQSGAIDKDQWVAVPHEGDTVIFTISKSHVSDVGHKFTTDSVIRVENLHALDIIADADPKGAIAKLYADLFADEQKRHRDATGEANLDDAAEEQAATAAAAAAKAATKTAATKATKTVKKK